jgi:hypothetical protein
MPSAPITKATVLPQIAETPRESGTHSDPLLDCEAFITIIRAGRRRLFFCRVERALNQRPQE